MNVLSLFATPLIVSNYECDEQTYNFLDSVGMTSDWSAAYGNKSVNTYILDELICINLSKHILQTTKTVMTEMLGFDIEDVQFTQSWISHKNPGEHHSKHSHANSIISGVYYFQNDIESLPPITFHNSRSVNGTYEINLPYQEITADKPFSWSTYTYTPIKNDLVMFPSHLNHSVGTNTSSKVRKSLAFNVIPTKLFGKKESLTLLDFQRLK